MKNSKNSKEPEIPYLLLYAVKDVKVPRFFPPFQAENESVAIRQFATAFNGNSMMSQHPSDYELYQIGAYHPQTARLTPIDSPVYVLNGVCITEPSEANNPYNLDDF